VDLLGLPDDEPILDQLTDVLACIRKQHYITDIQTTDRQYYPGTGAYI
jgi:hypothetical protein